MQDDIERRGKDFMPVTIAAIVAVIGSVGLFLMGLGPRDQVRQSRVDAITAAAAAKAGATALPTMPDPTLFP